MRIIAGFLSGIIGSMGMGGGSVLLIYLTLFESVTQLKAQGINLLFFLPTGALAVLIYAFSKRIKWKLVFKMWIGGIIGVIGGYFLAGVIGTYILQKIFAAFLILFGVYELFCGK